MREKYFDIMSLYDLVQYNKKVLGEVYWFQFKDNDVLDSVAKEAAIRNLKLKAYITGEGAKWGIKTTMILAAMPQEVEIPRFSAKKRNFLTGYVYKDFGRCYVWKTMRSKGYRVLCEFLEGVRHYGV